MRKVTGLSVVESPYCDDLKWILDPEDRTKIIAEAAPYEGTGDIELYRQCGVYSMAGVPVEITNLKYQDIPGMAVYSSISKTISDACYEGLQKGNVLLLPGSRCTFCVGLAGALQRALGTDKKIGIVWMDAHGDLNVPENSATGLLSGMPLAVILGLGIKDWQEAGGIQVPYKGEYALISDCRDMGPGARENAARENVKVLDTAAYQNPEKWNAAVSELAAKTDALWLHVDMDILDEKYLPDWGYPLSPGSEIETVQSNIKAVIDTGKTIAMSFSNVWMGFEETAGLETRALHAMRLMGAGLENWKTCPDF